MLGSNTTPLGLDDDLNLKGSIERDDKTGNEAETSDSSEIAPQPTPWFLSRASSTSNAVSSKKKKNS